jgi:hypothetical protein
MRARKVLAGLVMAAGSGAGAVLLRRRATRRRERAELYFGDGSVVTVTAGSPGAERLLAHARELLRAARA